MANVALENLQRLQAQVDSISGRGGPNEQGFITGPILQRRREKREAAANEKLIAAQSAADKSGRESSIAASGINPQAMSPGQMQGLMSMPIDQFESALDEVQGRQGVTMTPKQIQDVAKGAIDLSRASVEFRTAQQGERQAEMQTATDAINLERLQTGFTDPAAVSQVSDMLFDDRQRDMAPYKDRLGSYDQLMAVVDTPNGPASMATLFKFISSMDDSVVRDSEGRLLSSSAGPVQELVNSFNQIAGGGMFDATMRASIKQTATQLAQATHATAQSISQDHDTRMARFSELYQQPAINQLAAGVGFDPNRQFDTGTGGAAAPTPPLAAGETRTLPDGTEVTGL